MAEMTRRDRIMASSHKQRADRLPFYHYWRHKQDGWAERECRNRGMGLNWVRPPFVSTMHGVDVTEQTATIDGQKVIRRTYKTPIGSVYEEERRDPGTFQWKLNRSWKDVTPWVSPRMIKSPDDYPIVKYMVENTEYVADYFPVEQGLDWLGEDGIVMDQLPHSPMQMLMIHWVGSEGGRIFFEMVDHPELVEDLAKAISKSREPLYEIAAKSPAPVSLCGDNIDGVLVTPNIFKKYFMPEYEKQAAILHRHNKLMAVHMDGRLACLKDLIAQTHVDIVEAFHPMPMGDLRVDEALAAWPEKAIWLGFPGSIYGLGVEATTQYAVELLKELGSGDRLALAASTENLVSNQNLLALTSVMEKALLPLTPERIEEIGKRLA